MKHVLIFIQLIISSVVLSQQLTFNNLTYILDVKNEFDLNEYLDSKKFIHIRDQYSDTTTRIKVYGYEVLNENQSEEAIILYYDLSDKLSKVDYIFAELSKNNKFRLTYSSQNFVRKFAWSRNNINNAIFYNTKYTMYYKNFKNDFHLNTSTYIYEIVKRYGAYDRRDGYVTRKVKLYFQSLGNQDSSYLYRNNFKGFADYGYSTEEYIGENKIKIHKTFPNKFGKLNTKYSISIDGKDSFVYKSSIAEDNKPYLKYLLSEKFYEGDLAGVEKGRGYFSENGGEYIYFYKYDSDNFVKVYEKISLSSYDDSPHEEDFRDFAVQSDKISNAILQFDVGAVPNGKYYYKDDDIIIEGQYNYGLKDGIWFYKKGNEITKTLTYKNGELIEN